MSEMEVSSNRQNLDQSLELLISQLTEARQKLLTSDEGGTGNQKILELMHALGWRLIWISRNQIEKHNPSESLKECEYRIGDRPREDD